MVSCPAWADKGTGSHQEASSSTGRESAKDDRSATGENKPAKRALLLGHQALAAFEKGDFQVALDQFAEANEWAHSPVFVLYQARAAASLGRHELALRLYDRCLAEAITEASPSAWKMAYTQAHEERPQLRARLFEMDLQLLGELSLPVQIVLQGVEPASSSFKRRVDAAEEGRVSLVVPAGEYRLVVVDAEQRRQEQDVRAQGGGTLRLALAFAGGSTGLKGSEQVVNEGASQRGIGDLKRQGPGVLRRGAYGALASGAALLGGSLTYGVIAWQLGRKVRANCPNQRCPYEEKARTEKALLHARIATALFVGGLVGVSSGAALWVWDVRKRGPQKAHKKGPLSLELKATEATLSFRF